MFLSVLGWVFTAALSRKTRAETGIPPLLLICATALPVLIFVLTLPVGRPFAPGQGLGRGFLLGSFGALLASMSAPLVSTRLEGTLKSTAAVAGPWLMSCACNAFAVLFLRAELLDTLMGVAVGWFCAAVLLAVGSVQVSSTEAPTTPPAGIALVTSAVWTALLSAGLALSDLKGGGLHPGVQWSAALLAVATALPLTALVTAAPSKLAAALARALPLGRFAARLAGAALKDEEARSAAERAWRFLFTGAVMLAAAWTVSTKITANPDLLKCLGIGLGCGLLVWWLSADAAMRRPDTAAGVAPLASFAALAAVSMGYSLDLGFGVAAVSVGLATGVLYSATGAVHDADETDLAHRVAGSVLPILAAAAVVVLYRLEVSRFSELVRSAGMLDFFELMTILVGAVLPNALAAWQMGSEPVGATRSGGAAVRLAGVAVTLLAVCAVSILVWGEKSPLGLLLGFALGCLVPASAARSDNRTVWLHNGLRSLFATAGAMALAQWSGHLLRMEELTRGTRIQVVTGTAVLIGVLWILQAVVSSRGGQREEAQA
jgi:hypothetical protein